MLAGDAPTSCSAAAARTTRGAWPRARPCWPTSRSPGCSAAAPACACTTSARCAPPAASALLGLGAHRPPQRLPAPDGRPAADAGWRVAETDVPYVPRTGRSKVTGTWRGTWHAVQDMSAVLRTPAVATGTSAGRPEAVPRAGAVSPTGAVRRAQAVPPPGAGPGSGEVARAGARTEAGR